MKVIQMQYSPDAFDSFIKQKLDEVPVDSSATSQHWKEMSQDFDKGSKGSNTQIMYTLLDIFIIMSLIIFLYKGNKTAHIPVSLSNGESKQEGSVSIELQKVLGTIAVSYLKNLHIDAEDKMIDTKETVKPNNKYFPQLSKKGESIKRDIQSNKENIENVILINNAGPKKESNSRAIPSEGKEERNTINTYKVEKVLFDSLAQKKIIKPPAEQQKKKPGPTIIW